MTTAREQVRHILERVGLKQPSVPLEEAAYIRLATKGFKPAGIIDIGAYHGNWTRLARRVFGDVPTLMIEAQEDKTPLLDAVCRDLRDVRHVNAVLGSKAGETVTFYEMASGSSMFPEQSDVARTAKTMTTQTLDALAADIPGPLLLKIDVQGAELDVLTGGSATLSRADIVQLEVALLPYNAGAPTLIEVLQFMQAKGLVPLDLSGWSRPNGVDLAQIDLLFTQEESPLRVKFFEFGRS